MAFPRKQGRVTPIALYVCFQCGKRGVCMKKVSQIKQKKHTEVASYISDKVLKNNFYSF